jgi:hypothetical protein
MMEDDKEGVVPDSNTGDRSAGFLSVLISSGDRISESNQLDRLSYSSNFVSCILVETVVSDFHYSPSFAFVSVFQFMIFTSMYSIYSKIKVVVI